MRPLRKNILPKTKREGLVVRQSASGMQTTHFVDSAFPVSPLDDWVPFHSTSAVRFPLKAETETIWVTEVELLHAVWRSFGLVHVDSLGAEVGIHSINIGSSEEKPCVAVRSRAARVGSGRPLIVFVSGIQHKIYIVQPKPNPVVVWRSCVRVRLHDLEPQDVAVELQ